MPKERLYKVNQRVVMERTIVVRAASYAEALEVAKDPPTIAFLEHDPKIWIMDWSEVSEPTYRPLGIEEEG